MFQVGKIYSRVHDLQATYGGQRMAGAMTPKDKPYIFLLPTDQGHENGYTEHWEGDVFHTSGSGRSGDQEMKGQNRAARDHEADGKALYLFSPVSNHPGHYRYQCRVRYIGPYFRESAGADGKARREIVFKLQRVPDGEPAARGPQSERRGGSARGPGPRTGLDHPSDRPGN